jgi:hypothetical protein
MAAGGELSASVADRAGAAAATAAAALLWECCRRFPRPEAVAAAAAEVDAGAMVELAVYHGLSPLLRRALVLAGAEEERWRVLGELATVQEMQGILLVPEALRRAVAPLASAGLEPVVLKGPAVARRYPEPSQRTMVDVDVLLPRRQHRRAVAVLADAGWRPVRRGGHDRYDTVLAHPEVPGLPLELHYGLQSWYERATLVDAGQIFERRVPATGLCPGAFAPRPEDELVLLAAHAGKPYHGFSRCMWTADLVMVLTDGASTGVDWDEVTRVARHWRCTTVLAVALELVRRLGVGVPASELRLPPGGWRARALSRILSPLWPVEIAGWKDDSTYHLRFALADSRWRRLVLVAGGTHGLSPAGQLAWPLVAGQRALRRLRRLSTPVR